MDNSSTNAIINVASALGGTVVGATLAWVREAWTARGTRTRNATYLAIRVVCLLDQYVSDCAAVVADDGTIMGQEDPNGELDPQVPLPEAPQYAMDLDWRSIDANLAYRLLSLANDIRIANDSIDGTAEMAYGPDQYLLFEAREEQYSELGLKAHQLTKELRTTYKLPSPRTPEVWEWNPVERLTKAKEDVTQRKATHAKTMASATPFPQQAPG